MAAAPKVVIRVATEADYEGVMNITSNFNHGADYLQHSYHDLIRDQDSRYYVCLVDGEIAAFEGVSLIDEGDTLMARSARVKDKFQGQGLLNQVRQRIHQDYKDRPGQKRIRTCCLNVVRLVHSQTFRSQNRTLGSRAFTVYENLDFPNITESSPGVRELLPEDVAAIFGRPELVQQLFPNGFMEVCSWFFAPLTSNIRHILKHSPCFTCSTILANYLDEVNSKANYLDEVNSKAEDSQTQARSNSVAAPSGLLAVTTYYTNPDMLLLCIDIHGEPREGREEEDFKNIIEDSLKYMAGVVREKRYTYPVMVGVSTVDTDLIERCKNVLVARGGRPGQMDMCTRHYFFEQEFDRLLGK